MDHGAGPKLLDNFIFYPHTERFAFGWRSPIVGDIKKDLLEILGSEFPFDYDIVETAKY